MKLKIAAALTLALVAATAHADTMREYRAKCRMYVDKRFVFEGICTVDVGIEGAVSDVVKYLVTPPEGGAPIEVRRFQKRTATVNGVPAKEVAVVPGWVHFNASNGTDLRFTLPPKTTDNDL